MTLNDCVIASSEDIVSPPKLMQNTYFITPLLGINLPGSLLSAKTLLDIYANDAAFIASNENGNLYL